MTEKPFTAKQILQTAFQSVDATAMYLEVCKEWQQKADADKTWTNLKRHFAAVYHKIREQQRILGDAGFNSAHLAQETIDTATALDNIALAATANRNIINDLIAINKTLVESNTTVVAQVKSLVATNALLVNPQGTVSPNKLPSATNTR